MPRIKVTRTDADQESNHSIRTYARLVEMMNTGSTKIVDHSDVVPPEVFLEQDKLGKLDKGRLAEEIGSMVEMVVEFASDIADEAAESLAPVSQQFIEVPIVVKKHETFSVEVTSKLLERLSFAQSIEYKCESAEDLKDRIASGYLDPLAFDGHWETHEVEIIDVLKDDIKVIQKKSRNDEESDQ